MNKKEFLDKLRKKIEILNDDEVEDILNEYAGYIDEKVSNGKTEKEAVKELGNINEIASDLLEAYKVKNTNVENENIIEKAVNWITDFVDMVVANVKDKSFADILKFCFILAAIFLVILVCKVPFLIIESAGAGIFKGLGNIGDFLSYIWTTIIEFSYLFVAIIAFITIVKKQFIKEDIKKEKKPKEVNKAPKEKPVVEVKTSPKGFIEKLVDFCIKCAIVFLKFIGFIILIGLACYLIGVSFGLVISIFIFIKTLKFIGAIIICIGLISIGVAFSEVIFNFIFNRLTNFKRVFIAIIFSLLALGAGIGITSVQIANMNFKKAELNSNKEVTYKMNKSLVIKDFNDQDIVIKEDAKDIKVVYKYNDNFVKINTKESKEMYLYDYDYIINNKKIYNYIIDCLKKDSFYYDLTNVKVKVYVNEADYETLKKNYNNYIKAQREVIEEENNECNCDC